MWIRRASEASSRRATSLKKTASRRKRFCQLVVFREHDGQHPRGLLGVGRIFRAERHALVVVFNFPDERVSGEFEASEVVLPVGIIVRSEVVEGAYLLKRLAGEDRWKCSDCRR